MGVGGRDGSKREGGREGGGLFSAGATGRAEERHSLDFTVCHLLTRPLLPPFSFLDTPNTTNINTQNPQGPGHDPEAQWQ